MARAHLSDSHHWMRRKLKIDNGMFFRRYGMACRRDFAMAAANRVWRAVHFGLLGFDFLDDETSWHWVSGHCPGPLRRAPSILSQVCGGPLERNVLDEMTEALETQIIESISSPAKTSRFWAGRWRELR
jgi:hypothetical protein